MGAFEQKYGIPGDDAPSFEQKYGLEPKPAPAQNLAADETPAAISEALARGDEELFAAVDEGRVLTDAQRARMGEIEGNEFNRFGRVAKASPGAVGTIATEQFKKMFEGAKALWKGSEAAKMRKRGPFFDSLDPNAPMPTEDELRAGASIATNLELGAAENVREARLAGHRAAAAVPAEATDFEKNVIQGAGSGLASAGVILPSALLTPATGGGSAALGVGLLSAGAAGSRYADLVDTVERRMQDPNAPEIDHETAKESALMLGSLEGLTEAIPGATLVKKSPLGKKALEFLLTDLLGENISTVAEMVDDYRLQLRDDITVEQLADAIADTTVQTVVGGAVQLTAAQTLQKGLELANERSIKKLNDGIRSDINAGRNVPTGDEMAANLDATDAEQDRPRLNAPDYSQARTVVDSEGNARPETQTEEFHVEQRRKAAEQANNEAAANLGAEAAKAAAVPRLPAPDTTNSRVLVDSEGRARPEMAQEATAAAEAQAAKERFLARGQRNLTQRVDRAMDVPRLPAPDASGNPLVEDKGAVRRQSNNEMLAAEQERERRRDLGMTPTRVPIDDADTKMQAALTAAKEGKANDAQAKLLLENKYARRNASETLILLPLGRRTLKTLSERADNERKKADQTAVPAVGKGAQTPAGGSGGAGGANGGAGIDGASSANAALKPKQFDERLENRERRESVQGMSGEFGLHEKGGRLIRAEGDQGEVTGRTTHIASEIWKSRPATESGAQISYADAMDAMERLKSGAELKPTQQRFVTYLLDEQDRLQSEFEEKQKAEAPRHEAEIVEAIPDFPDQPEDVQTVTRLAKVAAEYATDEELEAALEAQTDKEAIRRLQRLVDRGWQPAQTVTGETSEQTTEEGLAADPGESPGESVAPEASRETEAADEGSEGDLTRDVGGSDERDADGQPIPPAPPREPAPAREERDPTAVPDDARAPKDVLGNRQFEEHSGIKLGDRVRTTGKHVGTVRRIFEIPGRTSKLGKKKTTPTKVRAEVYWPTKSPSESSEGSKTSGSVQNVDIEDLKRVDDELQSRPPTEQSEDQVPTQDGFGDDPIEDVGEKIGGARKDTATSTGAKGAKLPKPTDEGWRRRYIPAETVGRVDAQGRKVWVLLDKRKKGRFSGNKSYGEFSSEQEAIDAIPLIEVARNHSVTHDGKGKYYIWRKTGERSRVRVVEKDFDSGKEAMEYMATHAVEIIETQTSFGEEILPKPETVRRRGPMRRPGNVKGEDFLRDFGLRGVEFGNWNNQEERQEVMNHAYDALMDMAEVLAIPPKAVGLGGQLGLAFGARGHGLSGARAHYEPGYAVINLTKMSGAGTIGHEWFHALDHYFAQQDTKASSKREKNERGDDVFPDQSLDMLFASHGFRYANSGVREELRAAYTKLIKAMLEKAEQYVEDTQRTEKFVGETKSDLADQLQKMRNGLAKEAEWGAKKKPATAEQLAAFDAIAERLIAGEGLATKYVIPETRAKGRNALSGAKWTNDSLNGLSVILKAVRGRDGFNKDHGVLTSLRQYMERYSQRLKLLADAQASTTKTKMVPTNYRMEAKSIDQGRASQYWESPHEMAARAFQAYLEDKIGERGDVSDFLSYGSHFVAPTPWGWKRVYPTGDERVAINKAFDEFTKTLEVFEADGRVMLREDAATFSELGEAKGAGHQLDLFTVKPALPVARRIHKALAATALVQTGRMQTGIQAVKDWTDAAHIIAPLRKSPQEKFIAVVLNDSGKVLAVVSHTKGVVDGAMAENWSLLGSIARIEGASKVYLAHNHPSGKTDQSMADHLVTDKLQRMTQGTGITIEGMIVVAPGSKRASFYLPHQDQDSMMPVPTMARPLGVPIMERTLARVAPIPTKGFGLQSGFDVRTAQAAQDATMIAVKDGVKSGALAIDHSGKVIDVIEIPVSEMAKLRAGNAQQGALRILQRFESANVSNAVIFVPSGSEDAAHNLAALFDEAQIRSHDLMVYGLGKAMPVRPEMRGTFYAMGPREGTRMSTSAVETAIGPIMLNVNDLEIDVQVVATPYHLPKAIYNDLRAEGALELVKGVFVINNGESTIYMVASNIRSADHAREIVIHELAHYGIHSIMSAADYEREMDRIWELVPEQVRRIARENNIDITGVTGRRTAAEEVVAYASERMVNGENLEVAERSMLRRIFDAVRNWIAKLFPKMAIADREIADILRNAMASLTRAHKQRAPEDRVFRKSESVDEPPKGEPVDLSAQDKQRLNVNQIERQWQKIRVPVAWLVPQKPKHDFFKNQTAAQISKATDENPPLLEWVESHSGGYFEVVDGNHRVSAAKAAGVKEITAKYSVRPGQPDNSWLFSREAPIFYSALVRAAQDSKTQKASAAQWLATLRNTPGVKQEEIEWTGLEDWINSLGRPATRDEVAAFIAANQIVVKEQVSGSSTASDERKAVNNAIVRLTALGLTPEIIEDYTSQIDFVTDENENVAYQWNVTRQEWVDTLEGETAQISTQQLEALTALQVALGKLSESKDDEEAQTMYPEWTTPGGTNYREMVLQLPLSPWGPVQMEKRKAIFEKWKPELDDLWNQARAPSAGVEPYKLAQTVQLRRDAEADAASGPEREKYISTHWNSEENVLAHVRFNERVDVDGKRVLFIQEIQSDWHQGGRKKGYGTKPSVHEDGTGGFFVRGADGKDTISFATRDLAESYAKKSAFSGVPDAPFKTTWPELVFKRMVRWAAEHGFERIAWATGEMNAEVFGLDRVVSEITWYAADDGTRNLKIHMDGRQTIVMAFDEKGVISFSDDFNGRNISEVIGEGLAAKVLAKKEGHAAGDGLKIDAEGMRGFYDKMLPQMAAKIGKKWGAKVGQTSIDTQDTGLRERTEYVGPSHEWDQVRRVSKNQDLPAAIQKELADVAFEMDSGQSFAEAMKGASESAAKALGGKMVPRKNVYTKVHAMFVTDAMRDAAMAGQPLFSRRWSAGATGRGQAIRAGRRTFDLQDYGPWSSWWNYVVYQMQNKFYDLFRTQKELAAYRNMVNLPEREDANMAQTLYHGRAEERASEFWEQFVEDKKHPGRRTLVKMMREADKIGFGWANVEDWLYARHAKEANAQLLKVNDGDPTFNSGMSDVEADAILNSFVHPILDEIGAHVDAMTKWTRNNLVVNGIESQDTIDAWENTYKHYVPLKGWKDDPDVETMPRTGKGFDTGGKAKRRMGRTSKGDAILANVVAAAQASIIRSEKAKVGRALYEMVKNTDAPNLWTVDQVEYTKYIDPRDGLVRQVVNPNFVLAPNVVRVRIAGEDFHITFNPQDESMVRLAAAFKNLSNENMGRFLAVLHGINRFLSTINTTLTPEFVITNALRDVQTAMVAIGMTDAAALRTKVLANWKGAVRGIWNAERGNGTHPWAATWREFKLEGGKVGWLQHYDTAVSLEKDLQGLVEPDGTIKMVHGGIKAALKVVEDANMSVENAIRLATYKAAVDSGISKARAAEIAKNLTVNFNRKGNIGTAMNAWYLFYNAAVQGSSVVWGAVKNKNTRKIIYGIAAAGIAMDIINRMVGGEGDDKEREYDKIPEYIKESNMILMLPEGMRFTMPSGDKVSFLKVPLPYGFNTFYYTGTKIGGIVDHVLLGNKRVVKPMEDAALVGMAFFNAFSPVGGQSGSPIQAGAPTIADPFVQVWENKSFSGNPLMPVPSPFGNPPPDSERYFKSATQMARDMAHWLNEQTGGSEISPGGLDISPETIDHFWDFALGGLGRFMSGVGSTVHDVIVSPEDLELKEVPFLRRIAGEIGDRFVQDKFYEHVDEIAYANDEWNKALDMKRKSPEFLEQQAYTIDRYPVAVEMINDLRSTTRVIQKSRKEMKRLESRSGSMNEEKRLERLKSEKSYIEKEMNEFNRRWNEVEDSKMGERQKGRDITSKVGPLVDGKPKREAVVALRDAGFPATAALLWELPVNQPRAFAEWFARDAKRA